MPRGLSPFVLLCELRHESGPAELTRPHLHCQYRPGLPLEWLRRTQSSSLSKNSGMSFPEPNICILTLTTIIPSLVASQDNRNWGEP